MKVSGSLEISVVITSFSIEQESLDRSTDRGIAPPPPNLGRAYSLLVGKDGNAVNW